MCSNAWGTPSRSVRRPAFRVQGLGLSVQGLGFNLGLGPLEAVCQYRGSGEFGVFYRPLPYQIMYQQFAAREPFVKVSLSRFSSAPAFLLLSRQHV